jgi:uncharacterized surface protein with fasciclin (FAS1) repeats
LLITIYKNINMRLINKIKNIAAPLLVAGVLFASCNKVPEAPVPNVIPANPASGSTLGALIAANPDDSLFNKVLLRGASAAGSPLSGIINGGTTRYTIFVPNNNAVRVLINALSGGAVPLNAPDPNFVSFINTFVRPGQADTLVRYHIIPQAITSSSIATTFPNFAYPSIINPNPAASALVRLDNYPSRRANGAWLNNIPIVPGTDVAASNGVIHHIAAVAVPPSTFLWSRIDTDPDMTYLRAAILRADSGTTQVPGTLNSANLQSVLSNFGPNLTVFAPTDAAFKATLYAAVYPAVYNIIYQQAYAGAINGGFTPAQADAFATATATANAPGQTTSIVSTPGVFSNPLLYGGLTAQTVKGIVVYHLLGSRAFSVNLPSTTTSVPTLLNSAIPTHPGIGVTATFTGPSVTAATVKGVGNATAFPISINPTPNPFGTSDQHFVNGVLHKLNGVLLPQ